MKKLKLAIIGQGRSGRDIHGLFYKSEQNDIIDVVAVVEHDQLRRERAKEEYPGCEVYTEYTELFGRTDIDLVVNASFSQMHYPITKDLLAHGFNVMVEKPFARNYYECSDLIKTAKDNNVVLAVFQQTFFAPFYTEVKKIVASGKLGDLLQVDIRYNGLARRWDWQTLQSKMAGSVYNTGPHPIGLALDFLDFDDNFRVEYSKLAKALTSGDAEDYAKIILTAPNKPVVDVEINSTDAFSPYNLKLQGTRGTLICTYSDYKMKYVVVEENEPRPVIEEFLKNEEGYPMYCRDNLIKHEEEGKFEGTAFNVAVDRIYHMVYDAITAGKPMEVNAEMAAKIVNVIETVHAQNPMPVLF